jgi:hypothetical protein
MTAAFQINWLRLESRRFESSRHSQPRQLIDARGAGQPRHRTDQRLSAIGDANYGSIEMLLMTRFTP